MIDDRDSTRDQELVERLVRLAGSDTDVPAGGADRARDAVRPVWRRELRARARRRRLAVALPLAAALVLALAAGLLLRNPARSGAEPVAAVEVVQGTIEIVAPSGTTRLVSVVVPPVELAAGSRVRTGDDSRVSLRLARGHSLRLDHATSARLASPLSVELEGGAVYVDSGDVTGAAIVVRTPMAEVRELGTRFEVRHSGDAVVVRVRGGRVVVAARGQEQQVSEGVALVLDPVGDATRSRIAIHGPEWSWMQVVAPPFDIEGRTAVAFLEWASDETGLQVVYGDPETESLVAETILHGAVGDLVPEEALEVVMASCGLKVTRAGSTLMVGWGRQPPAAR
jgi:ferric-dicitrate binding protein FerR (iron transport regulator)